MNIGYLIDIKLSKILSLLRVYIYNVFYMVCPPHFDVGPPQFGGVPLKSGGDTPYKKYCKYKTLNKLNIFDKFISIK